VRRCRAPLDGQEIVVLLGDDSFDSDHSSDTSEDGDDIAGEYGAGFYSISGAAPLNTDNDADK
jgi:hypothetical protein